MLDVLLIHLVLESKPDISKIDDDGMRKIITKYCYGASLGREIIIWGMLDKI